MKRRWILAGAAALIALGVCLILFWFAPAGDRAEGELVLWYAGTECSTEGLEALAARCEKETGLRVEAVGFADERALADAFAEGRPDLLWCSHVRAFDIDEGEGLIVLPEKVACPEGSPEGFFPLGARLPVLLRSEALMPEAPASLEALLESGEKDVLGADCWADVLYEAMAALGHSMSGLRTADSTNPDYVRLHNLLGRAAFDGAAVNAPDAAERVRRGSLAAAVVDSMSLAQWEGDGLLVDPLPLPAGSAARYAGIWMGFARTKDGPATEAFLRWLSDKGRNTELALSLDLVPFHPGAGEGKTPPEAALLRIARGAAVSALDPGCSYLQNRESCEQALRLSLDLLA